jgi:hypothetical protein
LFQIIDGKELSGDESPSRARKLIRAEALRACDASIAVLEREAVLHEELFRGMLKELMTGQRRVQYKSAG